MKSHQAEYSVGVLCRTLNVSATGFYAWLIRKPSARRIANVALGERIAHWWNKSRRTYDQPRIQADLRDENIYASDKRVAALMRELNIQGASRRKEYTTTIRDKDAQPAPDLVDRKFIAAEPNQLWVSDITCIPTLSGFLFFAIVLDVFSRSVGGWATATHLRTELVLEALEMALHRRRPTDVIHHSDQGCQYTSIAFGKRCNDAGVRPSMGSVADRYDNAMCESFNSTLECELLVRSRFKTPQEAALAIFDFIEGFYNTHRRHTAIGSISPMEYERRMAQAA